MSKPIWTDEEFKSAKAGEFRGGMWCGVVVTLIGTVFLCMIVSHLSRNDLRLDVVKHGGAKWVTDENGNPVFRWNDERIEVEKK